MASRAKPIPANDPVVVEHVVLLPVSDIDQGERLRPVDPVWASALGKIMKVEGQRTPIEVCKLPGRKRWTLVAGAHRHSGAISEGIAELKAVVVENDADKRISREISENLWRRDLAPLERAAFIAELVTLHKQRHGVDPSKDGRSASAAARWQQELQAEAEDANVTMTFAYGWAEGIADRLGLSRSAIERDLHLHRRIPAGLIARLREVDHPALRNAAQLRSLAKLDEAQQTAAIDRLLWEETDSERRKPMTLAEAVAAQLQKHNRNPQPGDKLLSAFIGNFSRMSLGEKKGALAQLADILPAGYRLAFGEQPSANGFPENHAAEADNAAVLIENATHVIDGLIEDEVADGERLAELSAASLDLRRVRFSIMADRFPIQSGDRA